jgi:peptidyl-prolyl cis-trans isomerase C
MRFFLSLLAGCCVSLYGQEASPKEVTVPVNIMTPPPAAKVVSPDKVVLQVGDIKITAAQLDALIDIYPDNTRVFVRGPGRAQFADTVVRTLVMAEEARKRKLGESEKFKEQMRFTEENLLANLFNEVLQQEAEANEPVMRKYYEDHRCEYETWKARQIIVRTTGSPMAMRAGHTDLTTEEALAKITELRKRLAGGADFAALAKAESDDAATWPNGGDLGQVKHGQVLPSVEESLCKLNTGEVSEPVKTPMGYMLVQLVSKQVEDYATARPWIVQRLRADLVQKSIDAMIAGTKVVRDPEYYAPVEPPPPAETKK